MTCISENNPCLDTCYTIKTLKSAIEIAGKVSKGNTKMPGSTFALDAFECNVGSRLANVQGSACFKCYARRIQKLRPSVNMGWNNNQKKTIATLALDPKLWESAMEFQINRMGYNEHRWLDSGDVPNVQFLASVCEIARQTPNVMHWLPTREIKTLLAFIKQYGADHIPSNLNIRVSAPMVNDKPLSAFDNMPQITTSTVHDGHALVRGRFLVRYFYICELFAFAFIYLLRIIRIRWAETYHDLDAIIFY